MSTTPLPGLSNKSEAELRTIYATEVGAEAPAELSTIPKLTEAIKGHRARPVEPVAPTEPAAPDAPASQTPTPADSEEDEVDEVDEPAYQPRDPNADMDVFVTKLAAAIKGEPIPKTDAAPVAGVAVEAEVPEGHVAAVHEDGRTKFFPAAVWASYGQNTQGYTLKADKPASLPKA